ncbi:GNAT family N-acetyltransferase [Roseinatronobacter sp.]|uniref:GNAT family N-acetyltransferase n=1 Tax=Roseinatronobacter sp. TaxID=1945755 RepID=UPI0025CEDE04|nr:GNAT family N-acetyltransferase [Rhodobaca sp.]
MIFRKVSHPEDVTRLEAALRALSADISEDYTTDSAALSRAVLGMPPAAQGLLALQGDKTLGAALYSPVFSTVRGAAGIYISDLWVSAQARGQGLGARLLVQVARDGAALWQATWLKLAVYDHSHSAQQFYQRLGFKPASGMQEMRLGPQRVAELIKRTA